MSRIRPSLSCGINKVDCLFTLCMPYTILMQNARYSRCRRQDLAKFSQVNASQILCQTQRMNGLITRNIDFAKPLSIEKDARGNKALQLSFRFVLMHNVNNTQCLLVYMATLRFSMVVSARPSKVVVISESCLSPTEWARWLCHWPAVRCVFLGNPQH